MRDNALVLLSLGHGAGLQAAEMARLRGSHVTEDCEGVVVHVSGDKDRPVPVLRNWEELIFEFAESAGDRFLFRPDRDKADRHQTSNFIARCAKSAGGPPAFALQRLRTTWVVNHLISGVPPNELAKVAGMQRTQLAKYFNLLPDADPRTIRRWLREGSRP